MVSFGVLTSSKVTYLIVVRVAVAAACGRLMPHDDATAACDGLRPPAIWPACSQLPTPAAQQAQFVSSATPTITLLCYHDPTKGFTVG